MVLKHLFTTNQLLVGYILTLKVSFTTNIKLAWFLPCYFEHFQLSLVSHRSHSFKENLRKNAFPIKLVDNCIKNFLNKKFLNTPVTLTVKKKQ